MHVMFGVTGGVALSPAEFPSLTFAATRAAQALGVLSPRWLPTEPGRVTAGDLLADDLPASVVAVAVSLVDFRTGYLVDLEGIRQVIGDRLLIVDATQGFGVVDAPYWRGRRRRRGRTEVAASRLGHRVPRRQRASARPPHPGVVGILCHRLRRDADGPRT